ncbi:MAG: trigger factor [Rhodospirillales bacterium]
MQITETKNQGLKREFKIAVPAEDIEKNVSQRLKEMSRTIKMPGFRPGKVPVSLLRKKYGPSVIGEVLDKTLSETTNKVMTERGIRASMQPRIEVTSFEDGSDLEYTVEIELLPEIEPVDFSRIKLERLIVEVDEKDVDETLERLAAAHQTSEPVKSARKSLQGDIVVIDFTGSIDGAEFPGGKGEDYSLELGTSSFIPGFEDQLIGAKAGDHVDVKVEFPKDYGAQELAGKAAVFAVDIKELRQAAPAGIDDRLAQKLGMGSLDDLRNSIREDRRRDFKDASRQRLKRSLLDYLAGEYDFEVPEGLLERESESIWKEFEERRKADPATVDPQEAGKSDDELKDEFAAIAERRVRLGLLLSDVSRLNNIQVNQDDINRVLSMEAGRHSGREDEVTGYYRNNPQAMEALTAPLYEDKVIDFMIEMAEIKDRKVSLEELLKVPDEKPIKAKSKARASNKAPAKKTARKTESKKPAAKAKKPAKKPAKKT